MENFDELLKIIHQYYTQPKSQLCFLIWPLLKNYVAPYQRSAAEVLSIYEKEAWFVRFSDTAATINEKLISNIYEVNENKRQRQGMSNV